MTNKIIRKTDKKALPSQYSCIGDVIIPTSGETPEEIATATCVMLPNVILGGDLIIFRNAEVDGRIISYIINHVVNRNISRIAQGKSVVHIKADEISKIYINYPSTSEQQKLIAFLEDLSKRIEKQRQFVETLKLYKRGALPKLFPQEGEVTPKYRFPGFAEPWKQCKFDEVLETFPFKQYLKSPELNGKYEIIQQGNDPIVGYANGEPFKDFKNVVIFGDHTLSIYKPENPFFVATDGVRIIKGKYYINSNYLFSLLEKYKPKSEGYKRYYSILANTECFISNDILEQEKIGAFFQYFGCLIALHQKKLIGLEKIKAGLLQQLFI